MLAVKRGRLTDWRDGAHGFDGADGCAARKGAVLGRARPVDFTEGRGRYCFLGDAAVHLLNAIPQLFINVVFIVVRIIVIRHFIILDRISDDLG